MEKQSFVEKYREACVNPACNVIEMQSIPGQN